MARRKPITLAVEPGSRKSYDARNLFLEREMSGVQVDRVVRPPERRHCPARVGLVPGGEKGGLLGDRSRIRWIAPLDQAAAGSGFGCCGEKNLKVRVGEHHCPDI